MFCIVLRGMKGSKQWRIWRSVEVLSYHARERRVEILFLLYLENLLKDEENWLEVLHPGNANHLLLEKAWPFPNHVREAEQREPKCSTPANILASVYGRVFEMDGAKQLRHVTGLTPWDASHVDLERKPVTIWPAEQEGLRTKDAMQRVYPSSEKSKKKSEDETFVPFTVFQLGPFKKQGLTLLAFRLWFSGETYGELVEGDRVFTVDGPETLLMRIARKYVCGRNDSAEWLDRMKEFWTYVDIGESYDVILLQRGRSCERIRTVRECGIVKAPLQPHPYGAGMRYITANPRFCLSVAYAKNMRQATVRQAVGLSNRV